MRAAVVSEVVKAVAAWAVRGSVAALVGGTAVLSPRPRRRAGS